MVYDPSQTCEPKCHNIQWGRCYSIPRHMAERGHQRWLRQTRTTSIGAHHNSHRQRSIYGGSCLSYSNTTSRSICGSHCRHRLTARTYADGGHHWPAVRNHSGKTGIHGRNEQWICNDIFGRLLQTIQTWSFTMLPEHKDFPQLLPCNMCFRRSPTA